MSDINLNSLSHTELKEQARILGIPFNGNPSADNLRTWIAEAIGEQTAKAEEKAVAGRKKGWKTILIAENEKDAQPVFVGHNGKSYRIRRGEPVDVPPEVVTVLNDAIQMHPDGKGGFRAVPSYPFQILS